MKHQKNKMRLRASFLDFLDFYKFFTIFFPLKIKREGLFKKSSGMSSFINTIIKLLQSAELSARNPPLLLAK